MSVLSRVNWTAQQRVDLQHLLASDSFSSFDLRTLVTAFTGTSQPYIVRGFEVVGRSSLTLSIRVSNALVFNPNDDSGSFYTGLATDPDIQIDLPSNQSNVFVEAVFKRDTINPVNTGIWNELALTGENASGQEFSASVDFQEILDIEISVNTTGFTDGAIPLLRASTTTTVTSMIDSRPLLFRLATGGTNPDPLRKFEWSSSRGEPSASGTGVGNNAGSPWRARDASGALNDKAFRSVKEWADAIMTRFCEITGSSIWYLTSSPVSGLTLNQLFFDTIGHSIQPTENGTLKWSDSGSGLTLKNEGSLTLNPSTSQYHSGITSWKSNFSGLEWFVGGVFSNNIPGGKRNYTSSGLRFESDVPVDGGNIYLGLEREVSKGSGNNVLWADNSSYGSFNVDRAVSGIAGDFTGIALGDYIRKESEGYASYYKVVKMWDGLTEFDNTVDTQENYIANDNVIALELDRAIASGLSNEPLRFFRSRYSNDDIYVDTVTNEYTFQDSSFYWLGRRNGDLFILRDHGTLQPGQETLSIDNLLSKGVQSSKNSLTLIHALGARYHGTDGYELKDNSTSTLITIKKLQRNNTVENPGSGDNSGAQRTYTIDAPVGLLTLGQSIWVRLDDENDGTLVPGDVTDPTDAEDNTHVVNNVYEIRDASDTPLNNFDNVDVFKLSELQTINGKPTLVFFDGSMLNDYGLVLSNDVEFSNDVKILGDLIVEGSYIAFNIENLQSDDKLISLGVGSGVDQAGGGGIELADDTRQTTQAEAFNGQIYIDLTYAAPHGYVTGNIVGVNISDDVGGILAGQIGGQYTVVGIGGSQGDAEVTSATTLRIWTAGLATSDEVLAPGPRTFLSPWWIKLTNTNGQDAGITSWSFKVKNVSESVSITPFSGYRTVPTANHTNMLSTRIPFVNPDGVGLGGSDTTLNFSGNLTWSNGSNILTVTGEVSVTEDIEIGELSIAGPVSLPSLDDLKIYNSDRVLYSINSDGDRRKLTNFEENVLLVSEGELSYDLTSFSLDQDLFLQLNSVEGGASPINFNLGQGPFNVSATGRMVYAIIDRSLGTATVIDDVLSLPADIDHPERDIFLIAKRIGNLLYLRNGSSLQDGDVVNVGASGSLTIRQFNLVNNQTTPADIDDWVFDSTKNRGFKTEYYITRRYDDAAVFLDTVFNSNIGIGFTNEILSIGAQSDNKILVAGTFTTFNGNTRNRLVRLNSDGTEDVGFYTNLGTGFDNRVDAITVQSDNKIIASGNFLNFNGNTRNRLVRLNSDGTEDVGFYTNLGTGFTGGTRSNIIQPDNKILVCGDFTIFNGNPRNRLVRLNSDGTEDVGFYTNLGTGFAGGSVTALAVQPDNKILVGGFYSIFNGNPRTILVRLNSDGTEDVGFYTNLGTGFDNGILAFAIQSDNKIIIGGQFANFNGNTRNRLVRLNSDGTEDVGFYTNLGTGFVGRVNSVVIQPDNKILVAGTFTTFNGNTRNRLVRLNSDGTEDVDFYNSLDPMADNDINKVFLDNEKIYTGGVFADFSGDSLNRLAALSLIPETDLFQKGSIEGYYKPNTDTWEIGGESSIGDDTGVEFSITSAGQVQYTTTDLAGTEIESFIRFVNIKV